MKRLNKDTWGTKASTYEYLSDEFINIKYHQTNVVSFNCDKIILNTGGYKSLTTKLRMNQVSRLHNLRIYIYQENFDWFVEYLNTTFRFDGNTIELPRYVVDAPRDYPQFIKHNNIELYNAITNKYLGE